MCSYFISMDSCVFLNVLCFKNCHRFIPVLHTNYKMRHNADPESRLFCNHCLLVLSSFYRDKSARQLSSYKRWRSTLDFQISVLAMQNLPFHLQWEKIFRCTHSPSQSLLWHNLLHAFEQDTHGRISENSRRQMSKEMTRMHQKL